MKIEEFAGWSLLGLRGVKDMLVAFGMELVDMFRGHIVPLYVRARRLEI